MQQGLSVCSRQLPGSAPDLPFSPAFGVFGARIYQRWVEANTMGRSRELLAATLQTLLRDKAAPLQALDQPRSSS
jgi:hypothetical protein